MDSEDQRTDPDRDEAPPVAATQTEGSAPMPGARMTSVRARRVDLRRTNGQYEIYMGDRCIQTFCPQFEDVVRYALPEGSRQQVRINIEPLGEIRELATEDSRDRMREFAQQSQDRVQGLLRASMDPPQQPFREVGLDEDQVADLSPESLERLLVETRPRIGARVEAGPGVALESIEHPPRRSDSIQTEEGNIGWRATATHHLRQEINVIADMIDRLERI